MTDLRHRMQEDRLVRDSARALLHADIDNLRSDLARKSIGERALDRVADGAIDVYDEAIEVAADHKGALAAIVAALAVWFARHPLLAMFAEEDEDKVGETDPEQDHP